MKTIIVLAMHGSPPRDFPKKELAEFFELHSNLEQLSKEERTARRSRYAELEAKIRNWPRTAGNDPFHAGSQELATCFREEISLKVILGFNEFCAPSLDEALDQAAKAGAERVLVITPMMTRGGEHSERDIPSAIDRARQKFPGIDF